eukprot:1835927-Rhodomonas_salina.1
MHVGSLLSRLHHSPWYSPLPPSLPVRAHAGARRGCTREHYADAHSVLSACTQELMHTAVLSVCTQEYFVDAHGGTERVHT